MFKAISIRRHYPLKNDPIDIGTLVEAMLFYEKCIVSADYAVLRQLILQFGAQNLILLIQAGILEIEYAENSIAIDVSPIRASISYHDMWIIESKDHTLEKHLHALCTQNAKNFGKARYTAQKLGALIRLSSNEAKVAESTKGLVVERGFTTTFLPLILKAFAPGTTDAEIASMPSYIERRGGGILLESHLDFALLNSRYRAASGAQDDIISPTFLLLQLCNLENDVLVASDNQSELSSSSLNARLVELRISHLAQKCGQSRGLLNHFQEVIISNQRTLRDSINRGNIPVDDLMKLLLRARDFKAWLGRCSQDQSIVEQYYRELLRESFFERTTMKNLRWLLFTAIGAAAGFTLSPAAGMAAGAAIGAVDHFVIGRLVKGWRPSQFIEDDLRPLLR
ncbi:MAG TPA: hypothetical protein PLN52_14970 [Opitutaceae bacterium]|nr:hypothetical protein [Opitutaceae bacterium]